MAYPRHKRISEEIKKIVSTLIMYEIKDPRIPSLTGVTYVETTNDLRYTTIYISVLDKQADRAKILEGLNSAKGFIRKEIGRELKMHHTPEPLFKIDESVEQGLYINSLIQSVSQKRPVEDDDEEQRNDSDSELS